MSLLTPMDSCLIFPTCLYPCCAFQPICEHSFSLSHHLPTSGLRSFNVDDGHVGVSAWPLCSLSKICLTCIQTAAALQTWMLHYELITHAKAGELNKITDIGPLWDFVFECNQNLQRFLLILNPFHLSSIAAQQKTKGGGVALNFAILHVQLYIRMCPTLFWCYAVESLVMNSEQVQIGCSTSCCSEPSTTYAVLKWFLLFLFLPRFTSSCVSSLVQVVLTLLLRYSKVEYIDNGWKMFSVILFKHFYVPMNVILKDGHPIHICNCLKACSFVSSPCPTVKHKSLYIKIKAVSLFHSCPPHPAFDPIIRSTNVHSS